MGDGELVFIAAPTIGHLVAQVELAKNLVGHHSGISIAIHVLRLPITDANLDSYIRSLSPPSHDGDGRISLIELPPVDNPPPPEEWSSKSHFLIFSLFGNLYKPIVKRVVESRPRRPIGILTDMLIPQFVDLAEDLGLPSYVLYTSGVNSLAMTLKLESLGIHSALELPTLEVPGFRNPIPLNVWPGNLLNKEVSSLVISHGSMYRKTKGILVNTFAELDSEILVSLSADDLIPPVYAVGPVLNLDPSSVKHHPVIDWLDAQPLASVVFLCFGSIGSFQKEQVEQMATGIEQSGHRFLWSLRRQPNFENNERMPSDYDDFKEILPVGFLDRTKSIGKMIGWAPQLDVLAHPAVGAFVTHCGWNSVLESLWFGVPMVTWPMYAEQQLNAFYMVRELGIAVELSIDYRYDLAKKKGNVLVMAMEVERAIRKMMEEEQGAKVRIKVKEMSEFAKKALNDGGSSHLSLHVFTQDLIKNSRLS